QDLLHRGVSVDGERGGAHGSSRTETGGAAEDAGATARTVLSDISSAHREVYALYEIAQTLGSSLRLVEVLDLVVSKIGPPIPYHTCVLHLLEDRGDGLSPRFVQCAHPASLPGPAPRCAA